MHFTDEAQAGSKACMRLSGVTDNQGNSFALCKLMSSKFPLVVVLAEMAAQLKARHLELCLDWAPRDQNEEADALTNLDFSRFDPQRRVRIDLGHVKWKVLPGLMQVAENIYQDIQARKAKPQVPPEGFRKRRFGEKLTDRDPW